jgi:hypothetical protein
VGSLHETCNNNVVRVVNFTTSEIIVVKSAFFPHGKIYKYAWTSPDRKTCSQIDHILIEGNSQVYLVSDLLEGLTVVLKSV